MSKWNAAEYRKHSKNQEKWGLESIKLANIGISDNVLDIGCGDGRLTGRIAEIAKNGFVDGIDSSEKMIKLASKSFPRSVNRNIRFAVCDAREIKVEDKYDVAVSFSCLHWTNEHKKVLKGVKRALKDGGRIYFMFGGKDNAKNIHSEMHRLIKTDNWKKYFKNFKSPYFFPGIREYRKLLNDAGLKTVSLKYVPKSADFDDKDQLKGWIRTTWMPFTERVPESRREEFISEFADYYIKKYPAGKKGGSSVKMVRLVVEAEKSI